MAGSPGAGWFQGADGGWLPPDRKPATGASTTPATTTPTTTTASTTTPAAGSPTTPDPFLAMGGGQWNGSGWLPKDNPAAAAFAPVAPIVPPAVTPAAQTAAAVAPSATSSPTFAPGTGDAGWNAAAPASSPLTNGGSVYNTTTGTPYVAPVTTPPATTAPGSPGPGWFQGADGGWLPPDRAGTVPPSTGATTPPAAGTAPGTTPLAPGQPGEGWFQGADGGWLPPDRRGTVPELGGGTTTPPGTDPAAPVMRTTATNMGSSTFNYTPSAAPTWTGSNVSAPTYTAPDAFTAPDANAMTLDPGYQFRLTEGQRALENSGSARGVTRSGAMMADILKHGQGAASQEYQNVYDRARDQYDAATGRAKDLYGAQGDSYARDFTERTSAFAPQMAGWEAQNLAGQRGAELNFDRDWQKRLYEGDDAFRRQAYAGDDQYRRSTYAGDDAYRKQRDAYDNAYRDRVYAGDDAYRNKTFTADDKYRYDALDEQRKRYLIDAGLD